MTAILFMSCFFHDARGLDSSQRPVAGDQLSACVKAFQDKDEKGKDKQSNPEEMRAFVLGDSDAVGDFVLAQDPWNQLLFIDSMRWLVGEESFAGPPNTLPAP